MCANWPCSDRNTERLDFRYVDDSEIAFQRRGFATGNDTGGRCCQSRRSLKSPKNHSILEYADSSAPEEADGSTQ